MCIAGMGGLISTSTFKLRHKLIHHWKLDFLLMNGAHTPSTQAFPWTHTNTQAHTFTLQSTGLLARREGWAANILLSSFCPILLHICGMLLKLINCYFLICPLQVISYLTAFSGSVTLAVTSKHIEMCVLSQGSDLRHCCRLSNLQPGCQAWPCQSPFHYSSAINMRGKKGLIMNVREKVEALCMIFQLPFCIMFCTL